MSQKLGKVVSFRPYQIVRERLEAMEAAGWNKSDVINRVLLEHLGDYMASGIDFKIDLLKKMRRSLPAPKN